MKKILLLLSFFCLSGCIYNGNCWVPLIQTVGYHSCGENVTPYPIIAGYQKKNSIGHTDPKQRSKDIRACGSDDTLFDFSSGYKEFRKCLAVKGYIYIEPKDCGYQEPKWSTGKCNL